MNSSHGDSSLPGDVPRKGIGLAAAARYGLAILSVGAALQVGLLLQTFRFRVPAASLLLIAVAIPSWYVGRGPGVLSLVLAIPACYWFFVEPVHTIYIASSDVPYFIIFVGFALLLCWFGAIRKRIDRDLRQSRDRLYRLNRELNAMSSCNRVLVRATDEQSLLNDICRITCEEAGYRMAWVAYAERDEAKTVRPAAWSGTEAGYLRSAAITWADAERGRGPTGTAIRSGTTCCIQDFASDPRLAPWRESVLQRGIRSGIALPIKDEHGDTFGCLSIYSAQPDAFTSEEVRLLEDLAGDLAFGIVTLRSRAAGKRTEESLRESEARFRALWDHATDAFFLLDEASKVVDVNCQACLSLGYTREELIGMRPRDFDVGLDDAAIAGVATRVNGGETVTFETFHRRKDGGVFPVEIRARQFPRDARRFRLSLVRDITERKRAEEERQAHVWFLENMDRINRAMQGSNDLEQVMSDVLEVVRSIFECDRAWLVYPCDPQAPTWRVAMEHVRPEYPGAFALELNLPVDPEVASVFEAARSVRGAVRFGPGLDRPIPPALAERFRIRSMIAMVVLPKLGPPYLLGLHQCSGPRVWSPTEERLFQEIGRRLTDVLTSLLIFRSLGDSERRLEEAQRIAHVGYWDRDLHAGRITLSDEGARIFGLRPEERVIDLTVWHERWQTLIHAEDRPRAAAAAAAALAGGPRYEVEYRVVRHTGEVRIVHSEGDVIRDASGRPCRMFGIMQDITERKQAEAELRASEERFRTLVQFSFDVYWETDAQHRFTRQEFAAGLADAPAPGSEIGKRRWEIPYLEPDEDTWQQHRETLDAHLPFRDFELARPTPDGGKRYVSVSGLPVFDETGRFLGYRGVGRHITDRKRAEEALRQSRAYLSEAERLSHAGSWALDVTSGTYLYASDEFYRIFGLDAQEGLPRREDFSRLIHPEDWDRANASFEKQLRDKTDVTIEYRIVLPNGIVKHLHAIRHPVLNDAGDVVKLVGTVIDITDRKRAEDALRESETRFRTFVDHAADAFFMLDFKHGTIIDVNRRTCESLGYTREELLGMTPLAFDVDLNPHTLQAIAERAAAGETVVFERHRHRRKDGSLFPVEVQTSLFWHDGRRFLLKVARDITDRLKAEEQRDRVRQLEADLAHTNRVSMMGELAASVAHEVGQPLAGVVSNGAACLRWLARDVPNLEEAREAAKRIVRDGKRAGEIIARIRAMTKKEATANETLALNEIIREVLVLVGDEVKRPGVLVRTQFADDLATVAGDRVQLQQVVLNLVMNAIEAMITIEGRPRELMITTRNVEPDRVQVTVDDAGTGLDPSAMDKIFDAFYTTKPDGMGMGLSICRSILEAHGGRLWATAKDGGGTTFHFTLPRYTEEELHA